MTCYDDAAQMFVEGEWMDAVYCWLTSGGDPTLTVVVPTLIYGVVLMAFFIVGESPIMPIVMTLILGGIIFAAFPANALTILVVAVMFTISVAATVATWRLGR